MDKPQIPPITQIWRVKCEYTNIQCVHRKVTGALTSNTSSRQCHLRNLRFVPLCAGLNKRQSGTLRLQSPCSPIYPHAHTPIGGCGSAALCWFCFSTPVNLFLPFCGLRAWEPLDCRHTKSARLMLQRYRASAASTNVCVSLAVFSVLKS